MTSYQYRNSHCGDKTILRPSYLHNGISYTGKTTSLYWIRAQILNIESVKVWVTRLPSLSHPPLSMWRHRVTCLPPKNASAPWRGPGSRWLHIMIWQVSYIQYLLSCLKSQRSTPYNIVKSGLPWKRVFRRRHLGRRVTAVTCLRWTTVNNITSINSNL